MDVIPDKDGLDIELDDDEDWEEEKGVDWEEWTVGQEDTLTQEEKKDD